jgi:hypothetical protein
LTSQRASDGEPRIRDIDLGVFLGFARPDTIRRLIQRHHVALGVCVMVTQTSGLRGGRPGQEVWLNESQALYLVAKSETPVAIAMTIRARKNRPSAGVPVPSRPSRPRYEGMAVSNASEIDRPVPKGRRAVGTPRRDLGCRHRRAATCTACFNAEQTFPAERICCGLHTDRRRVCPTCGGKIDRPVPKGRRKCPSTSPNPS